MSQPPPVPRADPPPPERASWLHGMGEVAGFVGAASWAVLELAIGRWPAPREGAARPPRRRRTVAPYPSHD